MAEQTSFRINATDNDTRYASYAYPLIRSFRRAVDAGNGDPETFEKRLLGACEATIKYITTILIAQYRADELHIPQIDSELKKLSTPSLGIFTGLIREIIKAYKPFKNPLMQTVQEFYEDKPDEKTVERVARLVEISGIKEKPKKKTLETYTYLINAIGSFRNYTAHGASTDTGDYHERCEILSHILSALLDRIRFLADQSLIEVRAYTKTGKGISYEFRLWNGFFPKKHDEDFQADQPELLQGHLLWQPPSPENGQMLPLLDLFPLCLTVGGGEQGDVVFLNKVTGSKVDFLSYQNGRTTEITKGQIEFSQIRDGIQAFEIPVDSVGLPEHLQREMEVTEEAIVHYNHAQVMLGEESVEEAISFLEQAVKTSPGYVEAVRQLASLRESQGELQEAHETLEQYLTYASDNMDLLLMDAQVLRRMGKPDAAEGRLRQILDLDPDNESARTLVDNPDVSESSPEMDREGTEEGRRLPYEVIVEFISTWFVRVLPGKEDSRLRQLIAFMWRQRNGTITTKLALTVFVAAATAAQCLVFNIYQDLMMVLTTCSIGIMWGAVLWATFRIRRLLGESRNNFLAFLRPRAGDSADKLFDELVFMVLGNYTGTEKGTDRLKSIWRRNWKRCMTVVIGAVLGTFWLLIITQYKPFGKAVSVMYSLYGFLFFLSFVYLCSCLFLYNRLLKQLRFQSIHFSLVQHPKLSIRYLSYLSRRISYTLLVIYILATFTLYLGPFMANLAFIGALSVFLVVICYSYYSTIFLIRRVITQNKWGLIARFSRHFEEPFNQLISRAQKSDMSRLNDLLDMRDFIDSMDVWAERKGILFQTSLFYVAVLLFSTVGMSNVMTRHIMPSLSRYANNKTAVQQVITFGSEDDEQADLSELQVKAQNVDDTMIVIWSDDLEAVTDTSRYLSGTQVRRCDWYNGIHGSLDLQVKYGREQHILVVGYNKVFKGLPLMGGGKFSHDVEILQDGHPLLRDRTFVRFNTREIAYLAHIHVLRNGSQVEAIVTEGRTAQQEQVKQFVEWLETRLSQEGQARPELGL